MFLVYQIRNAECRMPDQKATCYKPILSHTRREMIMSTTTARPPILPAARTPGVLGTILRWIKRKTAANADHGVWSSGIRGM